VEATLAGDGLEGLRDPLKDRVRLDA